MLGTEGGQRGGLGPLGRGGRGNNQAAGVVDRQGGLGTGLGSRHGSRVRSGRLGCTSFLTLAVPCMSFLLTTFHTDGQSSLCKRPSYFVRKFLISLSPLHSSLPLPFPPVSCPFPPLPRADRLVRACAELPKLCEFFHIPFQSGDNDILREMKRGYTHQRYRAIIDSIRRYMPDASVSGDAIVGFPGEGAGKGREGAGYRGKGER